MKRTSASLARRVLHHEWVVGGELVKQAGEGGVEGHTVVFLHGLLGNGKNLRAPARELTRRHPHLKALLLDARGHGRTASTSSLSDALRPPHTFAEAALDVAETVEHVGAPAPVGVVGHSFGGRVALEYLRLTATTAAATTTAGGDGGIIPPPPATTWLLDTVPGSAHGSVAHVVESVSSVPLPIADKRELISYLTHEDRGVDPAIAAWMTTNLVRRGDDDGGGFEFAFDLDVVMSLLNDFPNQEFLGTLREIAEATAATDSSCEVNLVRAGRNDAWTDDVVVEEIAHVELLADGRGGDDDGEEEGGGGFKFRSYTLDDAGHWVHVDDLGGLVDAMEGSFHEHRLGHG